MCHKQHLAENYGGPPHAPGTKTGAVAASAPNFCGAEALPTTSASTASATAVADCAWAFFSLSRCGLPGGRPAHGPACYGGPCRAL